MGDVKFTVADRSNTSQSKPVKVDKNIVITNYTGDTMPANGLRVEVKDGKTKITGSTSDNKPTGNLRSADMASYKYTVFENLMKLDNDPSNLSEKDLELASKSLDGVKQVRRDKEAGVTTIVFDNGEILRFDFETDKEKYNRYNTEKQNTDRQRAARQEAKLKEQTIDPRSDLEKGFAAVVNWFIK